MKLLVCKGCVSVGVARAEGQQTKPDDSCPGHLQALDPVCGLEAEKTAVELPVLTVFVSRI